jgi:hypothetical protein
MDVPAYISKFVYDRVSTSGTAASSVLPACLQQPSWPVIHNRCPPKCALQWRESVRSIVFNVKSIHEACSSSAALPIPTSLQTKVQAGQELSHWVLPSQTTMLHMQCIQARLGCPQRMGQRQPRYAACSFTVLLPTNTIRTVQLQQQQGLKHVHIGTPTSV